MQKQGSSETLLQHTVRCASLSLSNIAARTLCQARKMLPSRLCKTVRNKNVLVGVTCCERSLNVLLLVTWAAQTQGLTTFFKAATAKRQTSIIPGAILHWHSCKHKVQSRRKWAEHTAEFLKWLYGLYKFPLQMGETLNYLGKNSHVTTETYYQIICMQYCVHWRREFWY